MDSPLYCTLEDDDVINNEVEHVFDTNQLKKDRFYLIKKHFDDYRSAADKTFKSKDKMIANLQERLNDLLEDKSHAGHSQVYLRALETERQKLIDRLEKIELKYDREKTEWEKERERLTSEKFDEHSLEMSKFEQNCLKEHEDMEALKTCLKNVQNANQILTKEISNLKNQSKRSDAEVIRKDEELDDHETRMKENERLNLKLKNSEFEDNAIKMDAPQKHLQVEIENTKLKRELHELRETYEIMDIEAEEKISMLANQIEELDAMLEDKSRECVVLQNALQECSLQQKWSEEKIANLEKRLTRHVDLQEEMKDELEKVVDQRKEWTKEKNDLLIRNASLNHELNFRRKNAHNERESMLYQVNMAGQELQGCIDKLKALEHEILKSAARTTKPALVSKNKAFSYNNLHFNAHDSKMSLSMANLATKIDALEKDVATKNLSNEDNIGCRLNRNRSSLLKRKSSRERINNYNF